MQAELHCRDCSSSVWRARSLFAHTKISCRRLTGRIDEAGLTDAAWTPINRIKLSGKVQGTLLERFGSDRQWHRQIFFTWG